MASSLLNLPTELRLEIWSLLLLYPPDCRLRPLPEVQNRSHIVQSVKSTYSKAIRSVCRQIRNEASPIFFNSAHFHLTPSSLPAVVEQRGCYHMLQHIVFDVPVEERLAPWAIWDTPYLDLYVRLEHMHQDEVAAKRIDSFAFSCTGFKSCTLSLSVQGYLEDFVIYDRTKKAITMLLDQTRTAQRVVLVIEAQMTDHYGVVDPEVGVRASLAEIKPSRSFACKKTWGPSNVHVEWLLECGQFPRDT